MIELFLELLQLYVIAKILVKVAKFLFSKKKIKKKYKRSILTKGWLLIANRIHYELNSMLRRQRAKLDAKRAAENQQPESDKIISLARYKKA
ncbi:MAG TPA: hypothetical protein GX708_22820 [Gallicola sp.]|nr:hypothetical protein [Gallicola sp.]